jgi:hypothetical protein
VEHVVFFPAHDGTPAFRRVAALEDAVRLVEHLRNVEGINEVSVHTLAEVPLAFRTVIKVELPGAVDTAPLVPAQAEAAAEAAVEVVPDVVAEAAVEAEVAEVAADEVPAVAADEPVAAVLEVVPDPEPALASSNGRSNEGAKSLGFFA